MSDDQELRGLGELLQYPNKAASVLLIERGIDFVQDTEGTGTSFEQCKNHRDGRQRSFASGQQFEAGDSLSWWTSFHLDSRHQRIFALLQFEVGNTPAEHQTEDLLEVLTHLREGFEEAGPALIIESFHRLADQVPGAGQICHFLCDRRMPGFFRLQFLHRLQIHIRIAPHPGLDLLVLRPHDIREGLPFGDPLQQGVSPLRDGSLLEGHLEILTHPLANPFDTNLAFVGGEQVILSTLLDLIPLGSTLPLPLLRSGTLQPARFEPPILFVTTRGDLLQLPTIGDLLLGEDHDLLKDLLATPTFLDELLGNVLTLLDPLIHFLRQTSLLSPVGSDPLLCSGGDQADALQILVQISQLSIERCNPLLMLLKELLDHHPFLTDLLQVDSCSVSQ